MNSTDLPEQIQMAASRLVDYTQARLDLLQSEWAIERVRLAGLFGAVVTALFFSFLTIVLVVALVVAWYWDTPWRVTAIVTSLVISLVSALASCFRYRTRSREPSALFQRSVEECARDRRAIDTLR